MALPSTGNVGVPPNLENAYLNDTLKRRGENWTHEETIYVIKLWRDHVEELRSSKRNYHVYQRIAELLRDKAMTRNAAEVKTKIMNLTAKYRKVRLEQQQTGSNPASLWRFFKDVHEIIGDIPFSDLSSSGNNDSLSDVMILADSCKGENVDSPAQSNASSGSGNLQIVESGPASKLWAMEGESADTTSSNFCSNSPPAWVRCRKRSHDFSNNTNVAPYEDEKVRCLREIVEEQKRCSTAVERLATNTSETLKEMLTLHRQSFAIQNRLMDILERLIVTNPNDSRNNSYL